MRQWRELFDLPDDVAYFNCASLAPLMRTARIAIEEGAARRSRPWVIGTKEWVDDIEHRRALFASLVGVDPEGVAMVPSASYGLATATRNLRITARSRIVLPSDEFPSDVYWQPSTNVVRSLPFPTCTGPTAACSTW